MAKEAEENMPAHHDDADDIPQMLFILNKTF